MIDVTKKMAGVRYKAALTHYIQCYLEYKCPLLRVHQGHKGKVCAGSLYLYYITYHIFFLCEKNQSNRNEALPHLSHWKKTF